MTRLRWKNLDPVPAGLPVDAPVDVGDRLEEALYKLQGQLDTAALELLTLAANTQGSAIIDLTGVVGVYQISEADSQKAVIILVNGDDVTQFSLFDSQSNPARYLFISCPSIPQITPIPLRASLANTIIAINEGMITEVAYGYYQAFEYQPFKLQDGNRGGISVESEGLAWIINADQVADSMLAPAVRADIAARQLLSEKGVANGYAPLDALGQVPAVNLPDPAVTSVNGYVGAVVLTAADVGLPNVDDTADLAKPVSLAQAAADSVVLAAAQSYADSKVINSIADADTTHAPSRNAVFDGFVAAQAYTDSKIIDSIADGDTAHAPTRNAVFDALAGKEGVVAAATAADYYRGDKTFQPLNRAAVGLPVVDNTADANKPVSIAQQAALDLKESLINKGAANGYAPLGADAKVPSSYLPAAVVGALNFKGTWDATANLITSADLSLNGNPVPVASAANTGYYMIVAVAGNTLIDGINDWEVGDWIISYGTAWAKIDNTYAVSSVNGQTGAVILTQTDVGLPLVDNTSDAAKNAAVATLTNKTISGINNTLSDINADSLVDGTTNKAYTAVERTKLAGIAVGATANSSDATLLNRANHTGTQLAATISDFASGVLASVLTGYVAGANTALAATDTVLQAFAKIQGQLNARLVATNAALGTLMNAGAAKAVPVDADVVGFLDSAASFAQVKATWAQVKAFLFTSSALTGTPTAPTAAANTNTTQLATTAFVMQQDNTATSQAQPANPATTTSAAGVMMGLAGTITPTRSGKVLVTISGDMDSSVTNGSVTSQLRTGTGAAPANGAALTGTARGGNVQQTNTALGVYRTAFSVQAVVTGLAVGTPVWLDLGLSAQGGGTARARNISITAVEV